MKKNMFGTTVLKHCVCAAICVCGLLALQAKTTVVYGCAFCGGGYVEYDDPDPIITPSSGCAFCGDGTVPSSGGSGSSSYSWSKAMTRQAYLVDSDSSYAGIATVTTSAMSKKGKVSVKVVFKMSNGKKYTASKTAFTPDEDGTVHATWASVKNIGAVDMTVTPDGDIDGTAGVYSFATEYTDDDDDDGTFVHGVHTFSVEAYDYEMPNDSYDLLGETIPEMVEIVTSNSKTWNCGKAPSIKYKKYKEDGSTWYELTGFDDPDKTNYSGLKLKYNPKNGTFSGSFTVYATNEGTKEKGKPSLKKYKFTVSGKISGSTGTGVAVCKKLKANWPITID